MNLVITLTMLATPLVVHSLVGSGFAGFVSGLSPVVGGIMVKTAVKAQKANSRCRTGIKNKEEREEQEFRRNW